MAIRCVKAVDHYGPLMGAARRCSRSYFVSALVPRRSCAEALSSDGVCRAIWILHRHSFVVLSRCFISVLRAPRRSIPRQVPIKAEQGRKCRRSHMLCHGIRRCSLEPHPAPSKRRQALHRLLHRCFTCSSTWRSTQYSPCSPPGISTVMSRNPQTVAVPFCRKRLPPTMPKPADRLPQFGSVQTKKSAIT